MINNICFQTTDQYYNAIIMSEIHYAYEKKLMGTITNLD